MNKWWSIFICLTGMSASLQAATLSQSGHINDNRVGHGTNGLVAGWSGATTDRMGNNNYTYSQGDCAIFYIFQLPALPSGHIVQTAKLTFDARVNAALTFNADLYGVRAATTLITVGTGDYGWGLNPGNGTLIQPALMTPATAILTTYTLQSTSAQGATNLASWLNQQYTSVGSGGYVLLRINSDGGTNSSRYYEMVMADNTAGLSKPTLVLDTLDISTGPCNLIFTNTAPAQFVQKPFVTTNLAFAVRNDGYNATTVTVSLAANYPWLTVNAGTNSIAAITGALPSAAAQTVTNLFNVTIASNAPVGTFPGAFTLNMQGTGLDGSVSNFSAPISLQILNTVFSSMAKKSFSAATNGTDTSTVTISNQSGWALSYTLSSSQNWLLYPTGTLSLASGSSTNITVTADATLTPGRGQYTDTLAVSYLNNTSTPNPTNFPIVFDVGPKIEPAFSPQSSSVVITSVGGTNLIAGYEPGEWLDITVFSTNNGAITVSNIAHSLSANGYFAITASNTANYGVMTVGAVTSTTYRVVIAANTPEAVYTLYATNSADGSFWDNPISLAIVNHATPSVNPGTLVLPAVAGGTSGQSVTITNSGNASLNFTITNNAVWSSMLSVDTSAAPSPQLSGGTAIPLVGPSSAQASYAGESDTISIGFGFPFYGTTYSNLYVDSNGAIILSTLNIVSNTAWADGTAGDLPRGSRPLIAPFRNKQLVISDANPVHFLRMSSPDRLVLIYSNVTLDVLTKGTNLQFQVELFSNGQIKFSYYKINGSQLNEVAVGLQGSASSYTNFNFIPASGTAVLVASAENRWVSYFPAGGTIPAFGSAMVTFTANGVAQAVGISNHFIATFNWSSGGSSNVDVKASVVAAVPLLVVSSNVIFYGNAGAIASNTIVLSNAGNAALNFTITDTNSSALTYQGAVVSNTVWTDISGSPAMTMLDPHENPYITATNEGLSALQPIGFAFPFYGGVYTQFSAGVNGGISLGFTNRMSAGNNFDTSRDDVPQQFIVPYWGDLALDSNASIRFRSTTNELVVTWQNMEQQGIIPGKDLTFQAVLYVSGRVEFRYQQINGYVWPFTKWGVRSGTSQNASGRLIFPGDAKVSTNEYGYSKTNYVNAIAGRAVLMTVSNKPVITYTPAQGTIPAGGAVAVTLCGNASGMTPGGANSVTNTANLDIAYEAGTSTVGVTFVVTNSVETVMASPLDEDGDGMSYDAELIAGTDPLLAGSVFTVSTTSGKMLSWTAAAGRTYTVWYTLNLADDFVKLDGAVGLITNSFIDTAHADAAVIYYKVTVD